MGFYRKNDVAGTSKNRCGCNNDVAGISDVPVKAYIDGEEFCRAVNRCLEAAEEDERHHRHRKCNCSNCSW